MAVGAQREAPHFPASPFLDTGLPGAAIPRNLLQWEPAPCYIWDVPVSPGDRAARQGHRTCSLQCPRSSDSQHICHHNFSTTGPHASPAPVALLPAGGSSKCFPRSLNDLSAPICMPEAARGHTASPPPTPRQGRIIIPVQSAQVGMWERSGQSTSAIYNWFIFCFALSDIPGNVGSGCPSSVGSSPLVPLSPSPSPPCQDVALPEGLPGPTSQSLMHQDRAAPSQPHTSAPG